LIRLKEVMIWEGKKVTPAKGHHQQAVMFAPSYSKLLQVGQGDTDWKVPKSSAAGDGFQLMTKGRAPAQLSAAEYS
jgi:hypothetical protein